ncbi:MAG: DNA-3-methyladenine glycosylase I [Bdellovibrionales bacterium]|nr:DNA-3-methyladenine glycosylase I [Bdellovibrionales bacterium]
MPPKKIFRCPWVKEDSELYLTYHDQEWGLPVHKDQKLFEMLCLEGAQSGLSWETILHKRENYRKLFKNFDPTKMSRIKDESLEKILKDPGIVRNRLKVFSVKKNARAFLQVQKEFGSFDRYIWGFVGGKTLHNHFTSMKQVPSQTAQSQAMSKDLKKRGFSFVGPTICYAFMQATGMVNDHLVDCFRYSLIKE